MHTQNFLSMKCITWYKDSHSLFDYESNKINATSFVFGPEYKKIFIFRKKQSCQVFAVEEGGQNQYKQNDYQLLTKFIPSQLPGSKLKLNFAIEQEDNKETKSNERLNTDESFEELSKKNQEEAYMIVRKLKKQNGEPMGYKMEPGFIVKLGRVEFFVGQVCINGKVSMASTKNKARVYASRNVMKYNPAQRNLIPEDTTLETNNQQSSAKVRQAEDKPQCKICLEETEDEENFLFKPCICKGSCGHIHLDCLIQWIHYKVKKEVYGGTQHYNFEKFKCEVCKTELPMILDINGQMKELLPIEKPQGDYLILEGACDKEKSVIMIQNIGEGIKLGRGHECQIRITDISVSRNHGLIKKQQDGFYIFDNKSKFGTLVKNNNMEMELGRTGQGIQIGRTVVSFEIKKSKDLKDRPEQLNQESTFVMKKKAQR